MTPTTTREYRVCLHEWDVYDTILTAGSAEEAIEMAQALYDEQGRDAFQQFSCGDDGFTAEEAGS